MSTLSVPKCPHCGRAAGFTLRYHDRSANDKFTLLFWVCPVCHHGLCTETPHNIIFPRYGDYHVAYPSPKNPKAPAFTPDDVASDYLEALTSLQHGNIKAACMMARSAVETAAVLHGAQNGGLKDKIDHLAKEHVITQSLADWAHEIKNIGNDAAHQAEKGVTLTQDDAEAAVGFAEMFLTYLFTMPGKISERRKTTP